MIKEVSNEEWESEILDEQLTEITKVLNDINKTVNKKDNIEIMTLIGKQQIILKNILSTLQSQPQPNNQELILSLNTIQNSITELKESIDKKKKWEFKINRDQETYYITSVTAIQTN